jgi:hypothetical protein
MTRYLRWLGTTAVALGALSACAGTSAPGDTTTTTSAGATSPTAASPTTSVATTSTTTTTTTTPSPAPGACRSSQAALAIERTSGAAGSAYVTIRLTNTGPTSCTTQGYPGVSLVGHGDGTQLGAAADRDRSVTPARVQVAAGGHTSFVVRVGQAANYDAAKCRPVAADGFRVYLPGETSALFLRASDLTGCADSTVHLLSVRPVGATAG